MIKVHKEILPDKRKPLWIGCSGGVDSVACLHLLKKLGYSVNVIHCNHNLRDQNTLMEDIVKDISNKLNTECLNVRRNGFLAKESEAELRDWRISQFSQCLKEGTLVLCHHLDDCVESYLMNCFNGNPEYCPIPIKSEYGKIAVVRPFMTTPKSEFVKYAKQNNLMRFVVDDDTNTDIKYRRNWIRHECRPKIEEHYPGIRKVVLKKMKNYYDDI